VIVPVIRILEAGIYYGPDLPDEVELHMKMLTRKSNDRGFG
jgi:hypothetical protein